MSIDGIETEADFTRLAARHRRELQVHCYRMLGSYEEAEDAVQEALLRAWRHRDTYAGRASLRAWLYRIATNTCLDAIERDPRRQKVASNGTATTNPAEILWLQPFPDHLLDEIADDAAGPDAVIVERETIELAFLVAIQCLPPNQRAVLILRDILNWPAKDTAELLDTSVASANSALQRARATLQDTLPARRTDWAPVEDPTDDELALLRKYMATQDASDNDAMADMLRADVRFTMPPDDLVIVGRESVREFTAPYLTRGSDQYMGEMRCVPVRANRQHGAAVYLRKPGDDAFNAMAIDILRIEDGEIAEITTFPGELIPLFGLPTTLES